MILVCAMSQIHIQITLRQLGCPTVEVDAAASISLLRSAVMIEKI